MTTWRERFFEPIGEAWFREGLVIGSADPAAIEKALARLEDGVPEVGWDLLADREFSGFPFRTSLVVRRSLGGFAAILRHRKRYDIVVLFDAAQPHFLRTRAWAALLLMRPLRFLIFKPSGEAFWLSIDDREIVRDHFPRLAAFWDGFFPGPRSFPSRFARASSAAASRVGRYVATTARKSWFLLIRTIFAVAGFAILIVSLAAMGFLRLFYDTRKCRFRILPTRLDPKTNESGSVTRSLSAVRVSPEVWFEAEPKHLFRTQGASTVVLRWCVDLAWVEVRRDAPAGELVFEGPGKGSCTVPGLRVDSVFYLQDGSRGNVTSPSRTVARTSVAIRNVHFAADPNPMDLPIGVHKGRVRLVWSVPGSHEVEVRVGEPGGALVARGGSRGETITGEWVEDGTVFYLLEEGDIIAELSVKVTSMLCRSMAAAASGAG